MRLPDAPLTLTDDPLCVDHNDLAVRDLADAQALLPGWALAQPSRVRDAFLAAWSAMARLLQARTGLVLGQVSGPRDAAGPWLDALGAAARMPRAPAEDDGSYRARLLARVAVVTPDAIEAAVRDLVAKYTPYPPAFQEPGTDAMFFAADDATPWGSYWQDDGSTVWADYPGNPNPTSGGYWDFGDGKAGFWVIVPAAGGGDPQPYCHATEATLLTAPAADFVVAEGATSSFVFGDGGTLLERLVPLVEAIRGAGVPWFGLVDPSIASGK